MKTRRLLGIASFRRWISTSGSSFKPREKLVEEDVADFTSKGLLPFLQHNLNKHFLPPAQVKRILGGLRPEYNFTPTQDQSHILEVLRTGNSVVHRGNTSQTGKSLALALYAMNHTLSRVPTYGSLTYLEGVKNSINAVIIVPTDNEVIDFYNRFSMLMENIPSNCCPSQIENGKITRVPLLVELQTSKKTTHLNSAKMSNIKKDNDKNDRSNLTENHDQNEPTPHILVTTIEKLEQTMSEKDIFRHVRFFAVDGLDFFINCTDVDGASNISVGKKGRYHLKIKKILSEIQKKEIQTYTDGLRKRLMTVRRSNRKNIDHYIQLIEFVENDNSLSIQKVEKLPNIDEHDKSYLKKLVKIKREVFYKQMQFCFICAPKGDFKLAIESFDKSKRSGAAYKKIESELENLNTKKVNKNIKSYKKLLHESLESIKPNDSRIEFIEKMVTFNDEERKVRSKENILVAISGDQNLIKPDVIFLNDSEMLDVLVNFPDMKGKFQKYEEEIKFTKDNVKNYRKKFLKQLKTRKNQGLKQSVAKFLAKFKSDTPFVIVIPRKHPKWKLKDHVIKYPHELIGQKIETKNLALFGIETLFYDSAFSSGNNEAQVAGIDNPSDDLFYFYSKKVSIEGSKLYVNLLKKDRTDFYMLSSLIAQNNITFDHKILSNNDSESKDTLSYDFPNL